MLSANWHGRVFSSVFDVVYVGVPGRSAVVAVAHLPPSSLVDGGREMGGSRKLDVVLPTTRKFKALFCTSVSTAIHFLHRAIQAGRISA